MVPLTGRSELLLLRGLHQCHVFGRLLVEVFQAGLAAQVHVRAFMGDFEGFPHPAELFVGNDALLERIGGGDTRVFAINGEGNAGSEYEAGDECEREFHRADSGVLVCCESKG